MKGKSLCSRRKSQSGLERSDRIETGEAARPVTAERRDEGQIALFKKKISKRFGAKRQD
jgi:hypothetical protein